ncbi:hypothetical protein SDC9_95903 [bioreactor metagenome]|uniref:Uncharacterized protein n=1 Tax=bioreactor metagenome TaxID=1076179 RepID=A0A645A7L0_9ZZZZ
MAPPEGSCHNFRGRCDRNIKHDGFYATLPQLAGEDFGGVFRVAVDRRVGNHDPLLLRGIGAPFFVFFYVITNVFPPDMAVERADHLHIAGSRFFEKGRSLLSVLADDVAVIPPRLIHIIAVEIHLVSKEGAVQGPKGAEGIGRE